MVRNYKFNWYKNEKYGEPLERHTFVRLTDAVGRVEVDAKRATELFVKSIGSLKYNTIISIQEFDDAGQQLGEDIIPEEGSSIVPTAK